MDSPVLDHHDGVFKIETKLREFLDTLYKKFHFQKNVTFNSVCRKFSSYPKPSLLLIYFQMNSFLSL